MTASKVRGTQTTFMSR